MRPAGSLAEKPASCGPFPLRGKTWSVRRLLVAALVLGLGLLVSGCSGFGSERKITVIHMRWDENVAVSTLTKILLEENLDYEVELKLAESLDSAFTEVADGEVDAFQDVWMPNHESLLTDVRGQVEHLEPWFEGETSYGIAVPYYMQTDSLAELDESGTDRIIGIEPGAAFHPQITEEVIPAYDLDVGLVESSTPAMLDEVDKAYRFKEPIVFLAWSPHWMNDEYDFRYLDDPKDAQGKFNDPARISSIVQEDLAEREPAAYEFLETLSLSEEEVIQLEADINEKGPESPAKGVEFWISQNRDVVQPWIEAARRTQET